MIRKTVLPKKIAALAITLIALLSTNCLVMGQAANGNWVNLDFDTANAGYAAGFGTAADPGNGSNPTTTVPGTGYLNLGQTYNLDIWRRAPSGSFGGNGQDGINDVQIRFDPVFTYNGADVTAAVIASGAFDPTNTANNNPVDLHVSWNSGGGGRLTVDREVNNLTNLHLALDAAGILVTNPAGGSGTVDAPDIAREAAGMTTLDGLEFGIVTTIDFVTVTGPSGTVIPHNLLRTSPPPDYNELNAPDNGIGTTGSVDIVSGQTSTDVWEHAYVTTNGSAAPTGTYYDGGYTAVPAGSWGVTGNSNTDNWEYGDPAGPNPDALANPDWEEDYAASGVTGPDDFARDIGLDSAGARNVGGVRRVLTQIQWGAMATVVEDPRTFGADYETNSSRAIQSLDNIEFFWIPEPSRGLLALLGAGILLFNRRRKINS